MPAEIDQCICKGNWRAIVKETKDLIGKTFVDHLGDKFHFFGVVHGDDDYYYGMHGEKGLRLLSCVGSIEGHNFKLINRVMAPTEHIQTDNCGFDRNESHNEGCYVCTCGWSENDETFGPFDNANELLESLHSEDNKVENLKSLIDGIKYVLVGASNLAPHEKAKLKEAIEILQRRAPDAESQELREAEDSSVGECMTVLFDYLGWKSGGLGAAAIEVIDQVTHLKTWRNEAVNLLQRLDGAGGLGLDRHSQIRNLLDKEKTKKEIQIEKNQKAIALLGSWIDSIPDDVDIDSLDQLMRDNPTWFRRMT